MSYFILCFVFVALQMHISLLLWSQQFNQVIKLVLRSGLQLELDYVVVSETKCIGINVSNYTT